MMTIKQIIMIQKCNNSITNSNDNKSFSNDKSDGSYVLLIQAFLKLAFYNY